MFLVMLGTITVETCVTMSCPMVRVLVGGNVAWLGVSQCASPARGGCIKIVLSHIWPGLVVCSNPSASGLVLIPI